MKKKLVLKTLKSIYLVDFNDIFYVESIRNQTIFSIKDKDNIIVSKTLKHYQQTLPDNFFRVHNSYIINMDHIDYISNYNIHLKNEVIVPVMPTNRKNLMNLLNN